MNKVNIRNILVALTIIITCLASGTFCVAFANDASSCVITEDTESGYTIVLDDGANLFLEEEKSELLKQLIKASNYGNAMIVTTDENTYNTTDKFADRYYRDRVGNEPGSIFVIDMSKRQIWIKGFESSQYTLTTAKANIIADNIYKLATNGEYGECAFKGYKLMIKALANQKITGKLKYFGNACLAIMLSVIIVFVVAFVTSVQKRASDKEIIDNTDRRINLVHPYLNLLYTEEKYSPQSSGSSSSGGGDGGGGGGGGGGGSSGGGHSF